MVRSNGREVWVSLLEGSSVCRVKMHPDNAFKEIEWDVVQSYLDGKIKGF